MALLSLADLCKVSVLWTGIVVLHLFLPLALAAPACSGDQCYRVYRLVDIEDQSKFGI